MGIKLPRFRVICESCGGHGAPETIAWSHQDQEWLCSDCWPEFDTTERTVPLVYAADALERDRMKQKLLVVATQRRLEGG